MMNRHVALAIEDKVLFNTLIGKTVPVEWSRQSSFGETVMNRMWWGLLLVLAITPAWGLKKITVGQLKDELATMHKEGKSDADVSGTLKQVELSEELTRSMMNSMVADVPGPLSTEQIYVLEARSAMLAPPTTDIPTEAAPDVAGQKAILDKGADYVSKMYSQLPVLTATRTTLRFQDNIRAAPASSGMHSGAVDISTGAGFSNGFQYMRYINSVNAQVESEHGAEKLPSEKDRTPWGANGMIALLDPVPSLTSVFVEAQRYRRYQVAALGADQRKSGCGLFF